MPSGVCNSYQPLSTGAAAADDADDDAAVDCCLDEAAPVDFGVDVAFCSSSRFFGTNVGTILPAGFGSSDDDEPVGVEAFVGVVAAAGPPTLGAPNRGVVAAAADVGVGLAFGAANRLVGDGAIACGGGAPDGGPPPPTLGRPLTEVPVLRKPPTPSAIAAKRSFPPPPPLLFGVDAAGATAAAAAGACPDGARTRGVVAEGGENAGAAGADGAEKAGAGGAEGAVNAGATGAAGALNDGADGTDDAVGVGAEANDAPAGRVVAAAVIEPPLGRPTTEPPAMRAPTGGGPAGGPRDTTGVGAGAGFNRASSPGTA